MALAESQARRRQQLLGMGIAVACWALLSAAYLAGIFETFDLRLLDWRFRLRGERPAADSIALLAIDDATIRAYKGAWPLPRESYALLLTALEHAGARAIGIDLLLPDNKALDPKSDRLLAYVSSKYDNIVCAVGFSSDFRDPARDPAPDPEALEAFRRQGVAADGISAPSAASASLPYLDLTVQAKALGHVTVEPDRDGAIRRQPLLVRYGDRLYPALALRMVGAARGHTAPPQVSAAGAGVRASWAADARWVLPRDREGFTAIDFAGDRSAFPNTYSMLEVLQWYKAGDERRLHEAFSNRTVLIGLMSRKEVTEDVGTTPFAAVTPLVLIHANVLDDLLRGRFLRRTPTVPYLAALAFLAAFLGWIFSTRSVPAAAIAAALALAGTAALDFILFSRWALDAPPVAALALAPVVYAATGSFRYLFLERRSQEREEDLREGRIVQQEFLPESLVGQTLSHYRIVKRLGGGGFGVVYLARDQRLNREVAVKVLRGRALADEKSRRRFRHEALALSKLNHPHIASIYDFDSQDGVDFIAMEFVAGTPLSDRIGRGALPEREAVLIAIQVAEALVEAHAHGVVHRDLKPGNVVLTPKGEAKVLDFGLARLARTSTGSATVSESLTEPNQIMGTFAYMPPETLEGQRADARSDLYSLGVVLFEMLTGHRPFPDEQPHELYSAILHQRPPAPSVLNARISSILERIVLRALEKDPARRPQNAQEFLLELRGTAARAAAASR